MTELEKLKEELQNLDPNAFRFFHNYTKYRHELEEKIKELEQDANI